MGQTTVVRARTGVMQASKVLGWDVENLQRERLGTLEDLVIDLNESRVAYALLALGGLPGGGGKLFPVPPPALSIRPEQRKFVLNVDKETLKAAPAFARENWPDMSDRQWAAGIYAFYGYPPYWP